VTKGLSVRGEGGDGEFMRATCSKDINMYHDMC
jgi:hypothetical protein